MVRVAYPLRWLSTALIVSVVLAQFWLISYLDSAFYQPLKFDESSWVIEEGQSLSSLANELKEADIIEDIVPMYILAALRGDSRKIRAGEYFFSSGITLSAMLDQLVAGEVVQHRVTILEGWTFKDMLERLRKEDKIQGQKYADSQEIMNLLGFANRDPEGLFFPDTYVYSGADSILGILHRSYAQMQKVLKDEWENRHSNLPIDTPYEALILASIIEKETGAESERRRIAGVFSNRLRKGMLLQSDPTVIYGLGDEFDGNLTRKHLRTKNAYNTYTTGGLPPTPICLPSRASIAAALNPLETDELYFVSRGDGTHHFSETFSEHRRAVKHYQLGQ